MKPKVEAAIVELRATFEGHAVTATEDGQGGATVEVADLEIGEQYEPSRSAVGFVITFQYPAADVYPHFLIANPLRADGSKLGEGMSRRQWNGAEVVQVSRRSNSWNPGVDSAAIKLMKVLEWIRTR